jgi:hypothetical protein
MWIATARWLTNGNRAESKTAGTWGMFILAMFILGMFNAADEAELRMVAANIAAARFDQLRMSFDCSAHLYPQVQLLGRV